MRSFDSVVQLNGTKGTTKNVMVARHQVGKPHTPFVEILTARLDTV